MPSRLNQLRSPHRGDHPSQLDGKRRTPPQPHHVLLHDGWRQLYENTAELGGDAAAGGTLTFPRKAKTAVRNFDARGTPALQQIGSEGSYGPQGQTTHSARPAPTLVPCSAPDGLYAYGITLPHV